MRSVSLILIVIASLALAEGLDRDAPSDLSLQSREAEVASVIAQQTRVEQLAQQITDRSKVLQEKMANLSALQTQLALHDDELLAKQKLLAAEQFVSSHHALDLQKEQDKVAAAQQQLLADQKRLSDLQRVLTYMRSPAFKRLERAKELNDQKKRQQSAAEEHSKHNAEESSLSLFSPSSSPSVESSSQSEGSQSQHLGQATSIVADYAEVTDFLRPGLYVLQGKVFADSGLKDSPTVVMQLEEDGSLVGFAEEKHGNQRTTVQIVGKHTHLGLEWVELRGSAISSCVGTFLPGSGAVTGTFSSPNGEQGSFDLSVRSVIPSGPAYVQLSSHPYLQSLPTPDMRRVSLSTSGVTLAAGLFRSQGKTINSVTGKETELPTFVFQLRSDGTLSGMTNFMPGARHGENVVRVAGHWTAKDLLFVFRFGGKVFHFKGSPSSDSSSDVIGGDYLFGKRGKGRFAFHFQKLQQM